MKTASGRPFTADVYFEGDGAVEAVDGAGAATFGDLHPHVVGYPQDLAHHTGDSQLGVELVPIANVVGVAVLPSPLSAAFLRV